MVEVKEKKLVLEDDAKESMSLMVEHRLPWLTVGLIGGIIATGIAAHFEAVLAKNLHLAFFIPIIVYMADAVGTQTESVFVRNLGRKRVHFLVYLYKEMGLGTILGTLFGTAAGSFAFLWFRDVQTAISVGLAMAITMATAPLVALCIPELLFKEHADPAIGSGPFATVIQDILSLFIYFLIASAIIFH